MLPPHERPGFIGYTRKGKPVYSISGGTNTFGITARAYCWYADGTETGMAAMAAENTALDLSMPSGDGEVVLRYAVQESGAGTASGVATDDYQLQYSKNGGAFTSITTATTSVQAFDSSNLTGTAATTRLLSAGTGSFIAAKISEDGIVNDWQLTGNNHSELVYTVRIVGADVADNDSITFRVLRNGAVFNTYTVTPTLTVDKTAPTPVDVSDSAMADDTSDLAADVGVSDAVVADDAIPGGLPYSTEVSADSPVAYWRLGDAGSTAVDEMGAFDGTHSFTPPTATSLLVGDSNLARSYNGTTQFTSMAGSSAFTPTQFSVEFWFKKAGRIGDNDYFFATAPTSQRGTIGIDSGPTGVQFRFYVAEGSSTVTQITTTDSSIWDGNAHHIVCIYDPSNGTAAQRLRVYKDSTLWMNGVGPGAWDTSGTQSVFIGSYDGNSSWSFWQGIMDEVAFYNTVLSTTRIAAHYTAGTAAAGGGVSAQITASDAATGADTVSTFAKATTDAASGADTSSLTTGGPTSDTNVRGRVGEVFLTGVTGDTFNITGLTPGDRATLLVAFEVQVAPTLTTATIANTLPSLTQAAAATTGPNTAAIASTLLSLTQAASVAVIAVVSDAAVATDTAALTVALAVTDAGTAADIAPSLGKTVTDAVVGSDVSALTAALPVTDAGSAADVSALTVALPVTDAAAGVDVSALTAALPVTDTGVAADTVSQRALAVTEIGSALDTATLNTASSVSTNDSATASDTAVVGAVATSVTDTGSAVDTATVLAGATAAITSPLPALTQAITAATIVTHAPVYDMFDRADGLMGTSTSGHTWIEQAGLWRISSNRAYRFDTTANQQTSVVIDSGFTSCSLSVDASFQAGLQDAGLVFADIDDDNYLLFAFATFAGPVYELRLWKREAGAFTLLSGPHPVAVYSSTTVTARVDWDAASGDVELWFGGVLIEAVTLESGDRDTYAVGTRQGLREFASMPGEKTYFDNYSVGAPSLPKLTTQVMVRNANTTGWSDPASDTTFTGVGTQVIVVTAGV